MTQPRGPAWTADEIALLLRLEAQRMRPYEIAAHFPDRTRSAVLGKLHRLSGNAKRRGARAYRTPEPLVPVHRVEHSDPCVRCGAARECPCRPSTGLTSRA